MVEDPGLELGLIVNKAKARLQDPSKAKARFEVPVAKYNWAFSTSKTRSSLRLEGLIQL